MPRQRIFYLDFIRAVAILAIVITHALVFNIPTKSYYYISMYAGSAALFFMTSGALIFPVGKAGPFLKKRLRSYLPAFLVWSVAYWALATYCHTHTDQPRSLAWILITPTFKGGWFIYALTGLYLFAPIISPWIERATKRDHEYFLLLWLLAGFLPLAQYFTYVRSFTDSFLAPFYGYMGFMVAGHYFRRWPMRERGRWEQLAFYVLAALAVSCSLLLFQKAWKWNFAAVLTDDLTVNCMVIVCLWFVLGQYVQRAPRIIERAVEFISQSSLDIYLCHVFWMDWLLNRTQLMSWQKVVYLLILSLATAFVFRLVRRRVFRPMLTAISKTNIKH